LDYAHRQGFVHRDIKPENILLQDGHALVADFGIARAIDAVGESRLTSSGMMPGTPAYMSPEQASGSPPLDGRTDLYSLGCVLYEMLTGSPPFAGPNAAAIVAQVMTGEPRPVTATRASASALEPVLARALARMPADRFATGHEFAAALAATSTAEQAVRLVSGRGWRRWLVRAAAAALALLAAAWFASSSGLFRTSEPSAALADGGKPRIAVLPIESASEEPADRVFVDAMHDQLIHELSGVEAVVVMDPRSVLEYRGSAKPVAEIAAELDVTHVVDARAAIAGGQVRINARLYDRSGESLWTHSFDPRALVDVLRLQADVAQAIALEIDAALRPEEEARLAARPPIDTVAFHLYSLGHRYFMEGGPAINVSVDSAMTLRLVAADLFEQATQVEPDWALAWAYRAKALTWAASSTSPPARADSLYRAAKGAADQAIQLDAGELAAYEAVGFTLQRLWEWEGARLAYAEARRINPNFADGGLAWLYVHEGRLPEAVTIFEQLRERDPKLPILQNIAGWVLACAGDYEAGLALLDPALVESIGPYERSRRANALIRAGRYQEAVAEFERVMRDGEYPMEGMAYAYRKVGNLPRARQIVEERVRRLNELSVSSQQYMIRRGSLSDDLAIQDHDRLIARLQQMLDERDQYLPHIRCEPYYQDLLEIPEAKAILEQMGLPL
ncbi:MAG: protein kinase, partial [Gemmatimonadetes bacterium]|nr:protein kinase [Gemmatimonadota bacterium]